MISTTYALTRRSRATRIQELNKALNSLEKTGDAEAALTMLSRALTNKLIHPPTAAIRTASADGKTELVDHLRQVYQLDAEPDQESKSDQSDGAE